jgi:hypothetical protein
MAPSHLITNLIMPAIQAKSLQRPSQRKVLERRRVAIPGAANVLNFAYKHPTHLNDPQSHHPKICTLDPDPSSPTKAHPLSTSQKISTGPTATNPTTIQPNFPTPPMLCQLFLICHRHRFFIY